MNTFVCLSPIIVTYNKLVEQKVFMHDIRKRARKYVEIATTLDFFQYLIIFLLAIALLAISFCVISVVLRKRGFCYL